MLNVAPPIPNALDSPVSSWRQQYNADLAQATEKLDRRRRQKLQGYGNWPTVLLDTFLLFVADIVFGILLLAVAFAVIWSDGHYLSGGQSLNTGVNHALNDVSKWSLSPIGLALSALIAQAAIVLVLQWRVVGRGIMSWRELGWGQALRRHPGRAFAIGIGLGLITLVAGEIILSVMHALGFDVNGQEQALKSIHHAQPLPLLFFAITATLTAPMAEETFFRAYALRALTVRYGLPTGIAVSSLFFGLLHLLGGVGWEAVALVAVGALLAWGYARTGNLITNITAHALNNVVGIVLLLHGS